MPSQYAPPTYQASAPGFPPPTNGSRPGSTLPPRPYPPPDALDDLIAGVLREAPAAAAAAEKKEKSKKDKNMRLIYNDENISPEEKMARLPRFAEFVRT